MLAVVNSKAGSSFARHSPNASMINSFLYGGSTQDMLTSNDFICSACYKVQLTIINSHEQTNQLSDMI